MRTKEDRLRTFSSRAGQLIARAGSIAEASRISGLPVNTVSRMKEGDNEPKAFAVATMAEKFGVSVDWLVGLDDDRVSSTNGWASAPGAVIVPVLDAEAAAGFGHIPDDVRQADAFPFPREFIERLGGSPRHVQALRATGDSMAPTIEPRALLMIDRLQHKLPPAPSVRGKKPRQGRRDDDIYVFFHRHEGLRLKRLRRLKGDFLALISDNIANYQPEILSAAEVGDIKVIGRVLWWDNRL